MKVFFKGELRHVEKGTEFSRRNGDKDYNASVTVEVEGRSQYFRTVSEVHKAFESGVIKKGDVYLFECDYNPHWKYNQFIVNKVCS